MADLLDFVQNYAHDHQLWSPHTRLLVAVSGGPDSLCLLDLLRRLAPLQHVYLHVAHFDHRLRPESVEDARFVAKTAAAWGLDITVAGGDIQPLVRVYGGVEGAARAARYRFLRETALSVGAAAVVTGHQADDQAETVMLRLLRGAGATGLAGIRPRLEWADWQGIGDGSSETPAPTPAPALVRPLLAVSRAAITAYCDAHGLQPQIDITNQSPNYLRNRVRDYIIPALKTYNSNIVGALGRTARICADEDALLNELLEREWATLATVAETQVMLQRADLTKLHRALRRRAFRRAASTLASGAELGAEHLDRMERMLERPTGRMQLPGGMWLRLTRAAVIMERTVGA